MPNNQSKLVSSKALAEAAKESYDAIDHWSEKGLLEFKRSGRRRLYNLSLLSRIKRIRELQERGYSLDAIRDTLSKN